MKNFLTSNCTCVRKETNIRYIIVIIFAIISTLAIKHQYHHNKAKVDLALVGRRERLKAWNTWALVWQGYGKNRSYRPFYVRISFQASSAPLHADGLLGDVVNLLLSAGQALVSLFWPPHIFLLYTSQMFGWQFDMYSFYISKSKHKWQKGP